MATILYAQDPDTGETETLSPDAVLTLSPDDSVSITSHPVESGGNVTDHARDEPETLSIECKVSTVPNPQKDDDVELSSLDLTVQTRTTPGTRTMALDIAKPPIQPSLDSLIGAAVGAIGDALTGGPKATAVANTKLRSVPRTAQAWQQTSPRNRVRDFYETLLGWKTKHLLVTIQTTMREYFDMMIERVGAPQTADGGNAITFQIDFKRIRTADSETVQSPEPAEARGGTGKNRGNQNGKNDKNGEAKAEAYESTLSQLTPG